MLKDGIELEECLYIHRKSRIHLLTKAVVTVLRRNADNHARAASSCDQPFQLSRQWLPRARAFRLSFQLYFADDVDLAPILSQDVTSIVADLVEGAEVRLTAS